MRQVFFAPLLAALLTAPPAEAASRGKVLGVANLNEASIEQLRELPGVSEQLAERIVEFRKSHKFTKVEDLTQVQGFSESKVNHLKSHLSVAGESTIHLEKKAGSSRSRSSYGRSQSRRGGLGSRQSSGNTQHKAKGRSSATHSKKHSPAANPDDSAIDSSADPTTGESSKPAHKSPGSSLKKEHGKSGPSARNHQQKGASAKKQRRTQGHRKSTAYTRHNAHGAANRTPRTRS